MTNLDALQLLLFLVFFESLIKEVLILGLLVLLFPLGPLERVFLKELLAVLSLQLFSLLKFLMND